MYNIRICDCTNKLLTLSSISKSFKRLLKIHTLSLECRRYTPLLTYPLPNGTGNTLKEKKKLYTTDNRSYFQKIGAQKVWPLHIHACTIIIIHMTAHVTCMIFVSMRGGVRWTCGSNRRLAEPHRVASSPTVGGG